MNVENAVSKAPECRRSELSNVSEQQHDIDVELESCVQVASSRSVWSSYWVPPIQTLGMPRERPNSSTGASLLLLMMRTGSAVRRPSRHACTTL